MKALVKPGPFPGLELRDVAIPQPGPGEVRIRVRQAAICGTDLHIHRWDDWAAENVTPGVIVGHEFVGIVDAVAEAAGHGGARDRHPPAARPEPELGQPAARPEQELGQPAAALRGRELRR